MATGVLNDQQIPLEHTLRIPEIAQKYNTRINVENIKLSDVRKDSIMFNLWVYGFII